MCLGVPGRITEIGERDGLRMASVDFGGTSREVCLAYVPEARLGDYCIVHAGFALNLLSEAEAQETLSLLREILDPGQSGIAGPSGFEGPARTEPSPQSGGAAS